MTDSGARVLVVDDEPNILELLSVSLKFQHFDVATAASGPAAIDKARTFRPDALVLDVMMPGMDGFGLLKELRARPDTHDMPVIFLSARAGEEASAAGREAGADDYIVKPFTARELLARVRATLKLQRERRIAAAQLTQILAQAPAAICVLRGPEYVFEFANAQFLDLVQNQDVIGRTLSDVVPSLEPEILAELDDVLRLGRPFVRKQWYRRAEHLPPEKRERWLDIVNCPMRDPNGNIMGIIGVVHDVTEQCKARRELERVNRELEEFAFVASHDLQEPLRMVNSYSQLLIRKMGSANREELQPYVDFIASGVRRMENLIQDLLSFARTVQRDEDEGERVDLGQALGRALESLTVQMEEAHATIERGPLLAVLADPVQVMQLFQNLISNALKYARPGVAPVIQIKAERDGPDVTVSVADNGIGFRQEYAVHIFGLFKRLHREEYPGTGLGLAICKRIVERYRGRIWAESTPGVGSTFFFALPAVD